MKKGLRVNGGVKAETIRLIDEEDNQVGVVRKEDALARAREVGLDLVEVAPTSDPPVCRIMDYGKFRFEQAKREKEARKNQHVVDIKEIRLSAKIDVHDFDVKVKNAIKFLASGDKVKVSVRFRGREMAHTSIGLVILKRFADACGEHGFVEREPKFEGRQCIMFLAPIKKK